MIEFDIDPTTAKKLIAGRGPRWAVQVGLHGGRRTVHFTDTGERAEAIYDRHVEEGGYLLAYTKVYPPTGSGDLSALGRARQDAKRAFDEATEILRAAVMRAIEDGRSESEIARDAGVDRMTVRKWQGKR